MYYGKVEAGEIDWRKNSPEGDDDMYGDEDIDTPQDVVDMLGFDPKLEFKDRKRQRIERALQQRQNLKGSKSSPKRENR